MRAWLLGHVLRGSSTVVRVQRFFGVTAAAPQRGVLAAHLAFSLGAALGNELFYLLALPSLFLLQSFPLGRKIILMWAVLYYLGQTLKDVLKLPRPARAHGVVALERHYETEYGFPSTHAAAAVAMPFYYAACLHADVFAEPMSAYALAPARHGLLWLAAPAAYCLLMTLSRLYMGVHTLPDIWGGLAIGVAVVATFIVYGDAWDAAIVNSPHSPLLAVIGAVLLLLLYLAVCRPPKWTNAFGDTALIIGVAAGVAVGTRYMRVWGLDAVASPPPPGVLPVVLRLVTAFPLLFLTRTVVKAVGTALMLVLFPTPPGKDAPPPGRRYIIEIPVKFLTYGCIGFNAVTVPAVFYHYGV